MKLANKTRILVADDEAHIRRILGEILENEGIQVVEAKNGMEALVAFKKDDHKFDAVFLDIKMPEMDGMKVLEKMMQLAPETPVIMISGHGDDDTAVECTQRGAYAFMRKPIDLHVMLVTLRNALERKNLVRALTNPLHIQEIIGSSQPILEVKEMIERVAHDDSSVLVTGPNGSGKELVAQWIHAKSPRSKGPIVEVNCAAIPDTLIESEFFGHKKGSFTDAHEDRPGKFEIANGGTIFLDEIGDLSKEAQAKILRALESRRVRRVGETKDMAIDVRVVAATNKDLILEIERGNFRLDLLNRLNVIPIEVPSLAERSDDIPQLVEHFMEKLKNSKEQPNRDIAPEAVELLCQYSWPGNIRELWNVMNRLFVLGDSTISAENVRKYLLNQQQARSVDPVGELINRFDRVDDLLEFLKKEWARRR